MGFIKAFGHSARYGVWLTGQIIKESVVMAVDTFGSGRHIAPVVVYYPLRITKERDIAAFIASITMTPGTLALGVTGPKEVDYDAAAGKLSSANTHATAANEFGTHGLDQVQRFLAVHAMYGSDPEDLLASLADMEEHLVPSVKGVSIDVDVEHLVETGRPGPRGFRGSHGGRASDETVFDVEKADSTPHAAAFVAEILRKEDSEPDVSELANMSRKQRYAVAQRHAERSAERKEAEREAAQPEASEQPTEGDAK